MRENGLVESGILWLIYHSDAKNRLLTYIFNITIFILKKKIIEKFKYNFYK